MADSSHDPSKFIEELTTKLASDSRHVCFFFGAGTGAPCELPLMSDLEKKVKNNLNGKHNGVTDNLFSSRDLEEALTYLRLIVELDINGQINGIDREKAEELDELICQEIIEALAIKNANIKPAIPFAKWLRGTTYNRPVEVFTTNYDIVLETAFEKTNVPYFDGFIGNLRARFQQEYVEHSSKSSSDKIPPDFIRLWKMHGSVNWLRDDDSIVRLGDEVSEDESTSGAADVGKVKAAAIYPSYQKYEQSRKPPYFALQDRFRHALNEEETLLIISGYSWGDEHINEIITEAARSNPRSEFINFSNSTMPIPAACHAREIPNLTSVDSCQAFWKEHGYWSEPQDSISDLVYRDGEFQLGDFNNLTNFLARAERGDEDEVEIFEIRRNQDSTGGE